MTTTMTSTPQSRSAALRSEWSGLRRVERICCLIGAALIASGVCHLGVFAIRGGPWNGPVSWRKPTTFGLSFGLMLITVTWVASYLRLGGRSRTWLFGIFAADCVLEVAGITVQAWRRVPSHFNTETPFDTFVAMNLAVGGAVLIVVLGALALTAFRGRIDASADLRLALRAGFAFLVVGLASGVVMIAHAEILINSGHLQAGYDSPGSVKWVHGMSLHAILVLPLLAVVLRSIGWSVDRRRSAVARAVGCYAVATGAAFLVAVVR